MPEDGSADTARLHGSASSHLRTLKGLYDSLFAPQFRALETYGAPPAQPPSLTEVVTGAQAVMEWHRRKELDIATEISRRRESRASPALVDEAARDLAYHRNEYARISAELAGVTGQ